MRPGTGLTQTAVKPAAVLLVMSGLRHIENNKLIGSLLLKTHDLAPSAKLSIFPVLCSWKLGILAALEARQKAVAEFAMVLLRVRELFTWTEDSALPEITCLLLPLTLD